MNPRERLLVILASAVGLIMVGRWLWIEKINGPLAAKRKQVETLVETQNSKKLELLEQSVAGNQLQQWKTKGIRSGTNHDSNLYRGYLLDLVKKSGIDQKSATVSPKPPEKPRGDSTLQKRNTILIYPFSMKVNCSLVQMASFLFWFSTTDISHCIKSVDILPVVSNDTLKEFTLNMEIEVLAFSDIPERKSLPIGGKAGSPPFDAYKLLTEKNPFQPTNVVREDQRVVAAPPPKPVQDDRPNTVFAGAPNVDGERELWFRNSKSNKYLMTKIGQKLEIPGLIATVMAYDQTENQLWLLVDEKPGTVRLGQNLASWKAATGVVPSSARKNVAPGAVSVN